MRLLLLSLYELGHQPLHPSLAAAALEAAGHAARVVDLTAGGVPASRSEGGWSEELAPHLDDVDAVLISVPMHTAARLAREVVRDLGPWGIPVGLFGLYADQVGGPGLHPGAAAVFVGEYLDAIVGWANAGVPRGVITRGLGRTPTPVPLRRDLPSPERYVHLERDGDAVPAGYVEASRGCRHRCRHCPVPVVYDGRIRVVDPEVVVADVAQQVAAGVGHVTFGDPDFLNAPAHARRVLAAVHAAYPDLTFDITTKVELLLRHAELLPELASRNVVFVVSAFESADDRILRYLDKGHTAADLVVAADLVRSAGMTVRPTWLPFTPWTTPRTLTDIVDLLGVTGLDATTDPVQLTIKLLIPRGSLLLDVPELIAYLDTFDDEALTYRWRYDDPKVATIERRLVEIHGDAVSSGEGPDATLARMSRAILAWADRPLPAVDGDPGRERAPVGERAQRPGPRLTEPWFC